MIKEVIENRDAVLLALSVIDKTYGLAEQITKDGNKLPARYTSKGDFEHIMLDEKNGICYHRIRGAMTRRKADEGENLEGCDDLLIEQWPMRLVWAIPRTKLGAKNDHNYVQLWIAQNIQNALWADGIRSVETTLQLEWIAVTDFTGQYDNEITWGEEYTGHPYKGPEKYTLGYLDYSIMFKGSESCFLDYDCDGLDT